MKIAGNRGSGQKARIAVLMFTALIYGSLTSVSGQADKRNIREGNRDYREGRFSDSELSYRRASEIPRGTPDAWFNLGNSIYRQQRFDDAISSYEKNLSLDDDNIKRSNAHYNIGNSLLSAGKAAESIEAYKKSLRLNPSNLEAKFNLAYAQDLLKEQQEQQQQQQQEQKDQQQEDKGDSRQENANKEQENSGDQKQDEKGQDSSQQNQPGQVMSQQDARRLLEALAENEKELQEKVKKEKAAAVAVRTLKNW